MLRCYAKKLVEKTKTLAEGLSNFVVLDENRFDDHDCPFSMSYNFDQLNKIGAKRFTVRLDSLLKIMR